MGICASACRRSGDDADAGADASAAPAASASTLPPLASASSSETAPKPPLQLLKFRFASAIKGKEPEDELTSAQPGERVYAHFTLRNRSSEARVVKVAFRVNGERRTLLELRVEPSWSFRTWGFNTLKHGDSGEISVEAIDDSGTLLVSEKLPIGKPRKK